jgi:hypothetical protein
MGVKHEAVLCRRCWYHADVRVRVSGVVSSKHTVVSDAAVGRGCQARGGVKRGGRARVSSTAMLDVSVLEALVSEVRRCR